MSETEHTADVPFHDQKSIEATYDDKIVKYFLVATILWAGVAFLLGIYAALELASYKFNLGLQWITFGRLRPLHTNAAIFAFAGNAIFAGIYHSSQRLLRTRLFSDALSKFHFWGWQLIILAAAITLPLGYSQSKEYAELEWPIDIAIAVVWVAFGVNLIQTIRRRKEPHIYVAIWFYIATVVTVALLHIVNSIEIPVGILKSYPVYAGVQDALVQWWYGHNAVAFVLTTPFLGLMYYYIPKAANRPVYSYRLSVIHFWSLVFIYIWAGPHHLLNTALPEWAQTMGVAFSVMLWIPSWGGMINGLMTLRGAWDKVKTEPVLKFMASATIFYGMATFEGPLLSIKSVSALAHYSDWIIAHVHGGALGWNGFLSFGMIYYLVPKLWKTKLYSKPLAEIHFWLGTVGIVLYMLSMWTAGITQGMMLNAVDASGRLVYPDFVQTVVRIIPLYWVRAFGGTLYFVGYLAMVYNVVKTIKLAPKEKELPANAVTGKVFTKDLGSLVKESMNDGPHRVLEGMPMLFTVLSVCAVLVGSVIEIVPMIASTDQSSAEYASFKVKPLSPLQLAGRDIYVREGCYLCHSQMIRTMVSDVLRYGPASEMADSRYDHPFQWGSKRTGPDLARVGGRYPDLWHYRHLLNPRDIVTQSIMPEYPWLFEQKLDLSTIPRRFSVLQTLGVPYTDAQIETSIDVAKQEAQAMAKTLEEQGGPKAMEDKEITALVAYLQTLGKQTEKIK